MVRRVLRILESLNGTHHLDKTWTLHINTSAHTSIRVHTFLRITNYCTEHTDLYTDAAYLQDPSAPPLHRGRREPQALGLSGSPPRDHQRPPAQQDPRVPPGLQVRRDPWARPPPPAPRAHLGRKTRVCMWWNVKGGVRSVHVGVF